jgi:signal transduction histidine kinase
MAECCDASKLKEGRVGTGLGLAVAKRIICDHDSHITAESRTGRGTTFHVTLPIEGI